MHRTITQESTFVEIFGHHAQVMMNAHGRVNLMGDHTDYNGGFVLPMAIPQRTTIELSPRRDHTVRLVSGQVQKSEIIHTYRIGEERRTQSWVDYIQALTYVLGQERIHLHGFDARITSTIPLGSGLSSSAALEMAFLKALRVVFHLPLSDVELAKIGQRAENEFVGAPVGIMDQMACMLADEDHALFLNTADLSFERVAIPGDLEIVVVNSGIGHSNAEGGYRARREECEEAARLLGVQYLSQLTPADLDRLADLPEPLGRRVRHVVTENRRVIETAEALATGEYFQLRRLFYESQQSLAEDYEVSVPEIDYLVYQSRFEDDIIGARLTGGGFGGCVVMIAMQGQGRAAAMKLIEDYYCRYHKRAAVLVP